MRGLIVFLLLFALLLTPDPGLTAEQQCPAHPELIVSAGHPEQARFICRVAGQALEYLAGYGLYPQREIRFNLVETSITSEGYDVYGRFDSRTDTIDLMSYQAIFSSLDSPTMYGEPFDPVHYAGAIVHEVAHAVMQHNLKTELISPAPQEYLAHAVQLALMPDARRAKILSGMEVGPWEPGDAISDIYMAIQPGKFAVKSYLHLTNLEEPEAFVRILLNANWFYVYVP